MQVFLPSPTFTENFGDHGTIFEPPQLDICFKSKVSGGAKEIDRLLEQATDRAGYAFDPLITLMNGGTNDEAQKNLVALATLAVGQSICCVNFVRRYLILKDHWGPAFAENAKTAIKQAGDQNGFADSMWLFGEKFGEISKNLTRAPPAPQLEKPGSSGGKGPARRKFATTFRSQPYNKYGTNQSNSHHQPSFKQAGRPRGFTNYRSVRSLRISHVLTPVTEGKITVQEGSKTPSEPFFRDVAPYGAVYRELEGNDQQSSSVRLDLGATVPIIENTSMSPQTCQLQAQRGRPTSFRAPSHKTSRHRYYSQMPRTQVLSGVVCQAKTRQLSQTHSRPISSEQATPKGALQDGESDTCSRINRQKRFYDEGRFKSGVLQYSNTSGFPTIPSLQVEGRIPNVHTALLRAEPRPSGIHQGNETGPEMDASNGGQDSVLPGRLLAVSSEQDVLPETDAMSHRETEQFGVHRELQQKCTNPGSEDRLSGDDDLLGDDDHIAAPAEKGESDRNYQGNSGEGEIIHDGDGFTNGKIRSNKTGVFHDSTILQENAEVVDCSDKGTRLDLPATNPTEEGDKRTTILGEFASRPQAPKDYRIPRLNNSSDDRCVADRVGSNDRQSPNTRAVESSAINPSHKRIGASSHRERPSSVSRSTEGSARINKRGQRDEPRVHLKKRRNKKPDPHERNVKNMGIGAKAKHKSGNRVSQGKGQHQGRSVVTVGSLDGEQRMEVEKGHVSGSAQGHGTITEGPIRKPAEPSTTTILFVGGQQCISSQVEQQRLCVSPVHSSGPSLKENTSRQMFDYPNSSPMGSSTVVPETIIDAARLPTATEIPQKPADRPTGQQSPVGSELKSGGISCLRERLETEGLPSEVSKLVTEAWSTGTTRQYESAWKQWTEWCENMGFEANPAVPNINHIASFLTHKFRRGTSYSRLNLLRSALSAFLPKLQGSSVGTHEIIEKLLKSFYIKNPPRPKYSATWNIDTVLEFWDKPNEHLSLLQLSIKAFTLLAIATLGRTADIRSLSANNYKLENDLKTESPVYMELLRLKLPKQQRSGTLLPVRVYALQQKDKENVCPVRTVSAYINRTLGIRPEGVNELFITSTKPHRAIAPRTGSGWILRSMKGAGIDTSTFKAHSICGASASGQVAKGWSCQDLLSGGRWSTTSTLKKFYLRDLD